MTSGIKSSFIKVGNYIVRCVRPQLVLLETAMGFCLSCCRRKKPVTDTERQPLLRSASSNIRQARTPLEHVADIIAAIHSGKLPSQDQLNGSLRKLLGSSILQNDKKLGDPALNAEGKKVIQDVREALTILLQLGTEKNGKSSLHVDIHVIYRMPQMTIYSRT